MTTEQQKQVHSFRLSNLTIRQLDWLVAQWGTSKTEALSVLVDRAYQQERASVDMLEIFAAGIDGGIFE